MLSGAEARALVDVPVAELVAEAGRLRDRGHGDRITFSPKVFIPLTMLCRDRCGYCTFAKPPARLDAPYLDARRGARDRPPRRGGRAATRRCSRWARRPRTATPPPRAGSTDHGYDSTVDYLVGRGGHRARRDRAAPPRQRRCALASRARAPPSGEPVAGDDDRDARRPARRAGRPAPRRARQDARRAGSRRSRPPAAAAVPFTTGILVGIGETRAERIDALLAIREQPRPPRARAGGDRPELPAQAGHRDAPRTRRATDDEFLWTVAAARARARARRCTSRRRPT